MAPIFNKGKGVASLSHGNKRSRGTQEVPMENASMPQQPPRNYGLCWVTKQEDVTHVMRERECLVFVLMTGRPVNVGEQQIDEEVIDYRPRYDPNGLDMSKIKDPEGIHGLVLSNSKRNVRIDAVEDERNDRGATATT
ncbi:hypothetical protein HAX54_006503 [Datura stramonium]|uniref:Uncharacterized protein n=1 Tax=Datura stramonium TaxID=4076 RepID=A0ABS8TAG4_DATST|nr:hypothetical protein [Datura stramonium]